MKCKRHSAVDTALTCGKCGVPICPRCTIQTPVGIRCPSCAKLRRLPTYQVSASYYLRAIGSGIGLAVVTGLIWGLLQTVIPFFYLRILFSAAAGFIIGEGISFSVNRKSGPWLAAIGATAVFGAYLVSLAFRGNVFSLFDIVTVGVGIFIAVSRLR